MEAALKQRSSRRSTQWPNSQAVGDAASEDISDTIRVVARRRRSSLAQRFGGWALLSPVPTRRAVAEDWAGQQPEATAVTVVSPPAPETSQAWPRQTVALTAPLSAQAQRPGGSDSDTDAGGPPAVLTLRSSRVHTMSVGKG